MDAFSGMETGSDMTLMFGLADKYFKAVIITMPDDIKESMFTMNKNIDIISRDIEMARKNQVENL